MPTPSTSRDTITSVPGPLKAAPGGHHLQKPDGTPFFYLASTEWMLNSHRDEQVLEILDARQHQGFTAVQVFLTRRGFNVWGPMNLRWAQCDAHGNYPFDNTTEFTGDNPHIDDPTAFNEAYWSRWTWIADEAARRGLYFAVCFGEPGRLDTACWADTPQKQYYYARLVGQRFQGKKHVIFVNGQDMNGDGTPYAPSIKVEGWRVMAEGLADGYNGAERGRVDYGTVCMLFHPTGENSSSQWFHHDEWLDANTVQCWHNTARVYEMVHEDYLKTPAKPTILFEGSYFQEEVHIFSGNNTQITALDVRQQAWFALFAGACGYGYGHADNWRQASSTAYVHGPEVGHMRVLADFLNARAWWCLVPDQDMIASASGTGLSRCVAVRASNGSEAFVYFPQPDLTMQIHFSGLAPASCYRLSWIDPRDGRILEADDYSSTDMPTVGTPAGFEDAILSIHPANME